MVLNIERAIFQDISKEIAKKDSKIIVIYGARQVGKTTLVENVLKGSKKKILRINGDDVSGSEDIFSRNLEKLESLVSGYDLLFIDEAQRIPEIGINLKIIYDNIKNLKIIVTGSSSLDLASSIKEPLTGRKKQFNLYPISILELKKHLTNHELNKSLEERLIFGSYPNLFSIKNRLERISYISDMTQDYLYKDVLEIENVKYHHKIRDLLALLSFQIGSEVSINELATRLGINHDTVMRYIDLLEKSFVIKTLGSWSRNLRKEVSKKPKIYFCDLGIRNALINNFADFNVRNDIGALWENFLFIERQKRNDYQKHICSNYFWRTYTGAELDYVESYDGELFGYEFKLNKSKKVPKLWEDEYDGNYLCVTKDNYLKFIT